MTDDRALKRTIRARMMRTGEKYTEARRAVVGGEPEAAHELTLFDQFRRRDPTPATGLEHSFTFMNRVDQPYWAEVRRVLELWFSHYPAEDASHLRDRFRSKRSGQHWSAWWELYLHELFTRLGFEVTPHPKLADSENRPDYALRRGELQLYVEAAVAFSGIVGDDLAPSWMTDAINTVVSPGFFVLIKEIESRGPDQLSRAQVRAPIQTWLETLDPDEVARVHARARTLPSMTFDVRGWRVRLKAAPVKAEARGKPGHKVYGGGPAVGGMVNDVAQLRDKLKTKAGRYGRPEIPIVTAVLCASSFMEDQDVAQALYGTDAVQIVGPGASKMIRQRDGFWMHESGAQNRRVSAVLTATQLHPWTCTTTTPRLWLNPWAEHALGVDLPFPVGTASEAGLIEFVPRDPDMAAILDLPKPWPGGEPFLREAS